MLAVEHFGAEVPITAPALARTVLSRKRQELVVRFPASFAAVEHCEVAELRLSDFAAVLRRFGRWPSEQFSALRALLAALAALHKSRNAAAVRPKSCFREPLLAFLGDRNSCFIGVPS